MIPAQTSLQDANSPVIHSLSQLHDYAIIIISLIVTYVFYTIVCLIKRPYRSFIPYEHHQLEAIWTLFPALTLTCLAIPSIQLLYSFDELRNPIITIKTTGHQWYWRYDYADFVQTEFDSFITPTNTLNKGEFRLLEVDNRIILPWNVETRILVTAADVLHSWTIPCIGVKADAIPGRLNQTNLIPLNPGVFYGQCSEICGANHSFIPIALEVVKPVVWSNWVNNISKQLV